MPACDFDLFRLKPQRLGAFGVLRQNGYPFAVTLEHTYESPDGLQFVKIPSGVWTCRRTRFYRGGYETFEVIVPGHSRLLFHKGNGEEDSDGCILVAESFGELGDIPAVLRSKSGFEEFMRRAGERLEFTLGVVQEC